jgi:hypothetical protein
MKLTVDVLAAAYKQLLGSFDKKFSLIENHLRNLSNEIEEDKIAANYSMV